MTLSDRLAKAKKERFEPPPPAESRSMEETIASRHSRRKVDPFAELKLAVHQSLLEALGPKLYDVTMTQTELESQVRATLQEVLANQETPLTVADRSRIAQDVADDILGYGPLEPYLRDQDVTEVMANGPHSLYVERAGLIEPVDGTFVDEAHLRRTIEKIVARVGRRVDEASPMVDARLPDGSRVNAIVPPLALDGALLTIRKFATDPFDVEDLISFGTFTAPVAEFLRAELVLLDEVVGKRDREDEAAVVGEPAPPDLDRGEAVARRVALVSGGVAQIVVAALRGRRAVRGERVDRGHLRRVAAQIDVVVEVAVGDEV